MSIKWDEKQRKRALKPSKDPWHEFDTQMRDTLEICLVVIVVLLLGALYVAKGPKWPEGRESEARRFESTSAVPGRPGQPTLRGSKAPRSE